MKLIALLLALALERLATQLFQFRELRWLDRLFDPWLKLVERFTQIPGWILATVGICVFVLPVFLLHLATGDVLYGAPYVALSVFVLFFSLGPQDIGEEVDAWCEAVEAGDEQRAKQLAKALLECDPRINVRIDDAIFVQSNNRIFAVVFWFIVLGPIGAWAVRVADLMRRRAVFQLQRSRSGDATDATEVDRRQHAADSTDYVHALLAWLPARIAAMSFALAGSFDNGREAWSVAPAEPTEQSLGAENESLLARVGTAALAFAPKPDEPAPQQQVRSARAASGLVFRALVFWAVAVAVLTLFGPAV